MSLKQERYDSEVVPVRSGCRDILTGYEATVPLDTHLYFVMKLIDAATNKPIYQRWIRQNER